MTYYILSRLIEVPELQLSNCVSFLTVWLVWPVNRQVFLLAMMFIR